MKITEIIWIEDIVEKLILKHNVKDLEVIEVFKNRPEFRFVEKGHRKGENVYAALGQTNSGRKLIVFFVHKGGKQALIVSARDMRSSERKRYEQR